MLKEDLTKIYDAHTHFNDSSYEENGIAIKTIVEDAEKEGVGYFNDVAFDLDSSILAIEQAKQFDNVFATVGIHPTEIETLTNEVYDQLNILAMDTKVVAIGEVGIDYFYTKETKEQQAIGFQKMIDLAIARNKTLMMHIRDERNVYTAYDDAIAILSRNSIARKVVHCFSANVDYAKKFLNLGCYIEIGGAVTFKNAKELQEAVKVIPLERMLVETDAPYLTPHPHRGEMNFSKNIVLTVEKIAELKNVSKEEVIAKTTENAFNLFLK
ncbi:TatD family hydrolase [Mesoplasma lactucae]|uniref:Hydrolase TatD n=1 Tax=Mesoplasma lactucae ATCC 49193 TaxID=81460 RepID=A0A291ISN8_9MOLU|nr:TatD family hydrolase [Mesoplasma lactucae]ATG97711.1 hydrolase TatD [Mesoplasma lactucae ATCC 49193]ATZ20514.1 Mg-dependent DNase [Mesoplasma lactucae ATCC 49193]MCL8216685.1 putative metal-dependent hydrolase YcfH [Mesoplasma lactucae ATCC 49193]